MCRTLRILLTLAVFLPPTAAHAQWILDGVPVGAAANTQEFPVIVADGFGGVFIVWEDYRPGTYPDIYAQHVNVMGVPQWTANGVAVCTAAFIQSRPQVVLDGAGGVIIAWGDDRAAANNNDVYVQRLNAAGVPQWTSNGVAVCTATNHQQYPFIAPDGAGGAIVGWRDERAGTFTYHMYAQRVNETGAPQWTANGVAVNNAVSAGEIAMISDGAGGVFASWSSTDIHAQRLNGSGAAQWGGGVAISTASNNQLSQRMVLDGVGGVIFSWSDNRNGSHYDVYAQRVNSAGLPQWTLNGVALCTAAGDQRWPQIVTNGSGGAIVTWEDYRGGTNADIYAQQISTAGAVPWTTNGVALCTATYDQTLPMIVPDDAGGAIAAWTDFRSSSTFNSTTDVYAQHVSNTGGTLWGADGLPVCVPGNPFLPQLAANGVGGAMLAWRDLRGAFADVYAQRIEKRYGAWGHPDARITSADDVTGDQGGHVMVIWAASDRDVFPTQEISHYTLWRELTGPALSTASTSAELDPSTIGDDFNGKGYRLVVTAAGTTEWEFIATVPIRYASEYGFNTLTLADSTAASSADAGYQVLAHTTNPFVFYEGNVFVGHSVDNLAPAAPTALTAQRVGSDVHLAWNAVEASDLMTYSVYRATSSGVTPVPVNFLGSSNDVVLVDAGAPSSSLYYIVTAQDVHGNQGPPSNQASVSPVTGTGDLPPIESFTVLQNHPNPFTGATEFQVGLPAASDISLEVYDVAGRSVRRELVARRTAGWQRLSFDGRDNAGRTLASGVYFCRVSAGGANLTRKIVITR